MEKHEARDLREEVRAALEGVGPLEIDLPAGYMAEPRGEGSYMVWDPEGEVLDLADSVEAAAELVIADIDEREARGAVLEIDERVIVLPADDRPVPRIPPGENQHGDIVAILTGSSLRPYIVQLQNGDTFAYSRDELEPTA